MSRMSDLADELRRIVVELDDLAFDELQRAIAEQLTTRPESDRVITRARRSIEKAIQLLDPDGAG
jgi:hypothetical protein